MKLSTLFIIASLFTMQAKETYGQGEKVTFNYENISLNQFIDKIENGTDYRFVFKVDDVDLKRSFDIEVNDEPLGDVLNKVFETTNTEFKIVRHRVYLIKRLKKQEAPNQSLFKVQQNTVEGIVVDQNDIPLPGATIVEVDSQNGASTDFNGNFSLSLINFPTKIKVSFIGFKSQEISVSSYQPITIKLEEDNNLLNEVVIVGYGETSREKISTAVSTVDTKRIEQRPVADVSSSLQGLSPGLNITQSSGKVGSEPTINIRGFTSINGGSPLILIDGIEGDLSTLNPDDVASISVLKDAGAAAIYGARGSFGVVLVTTKNADNGSLQVNIGVTTAISSPTMNTDFLTDPYKAVSIVDESFRNNSGASYTGYTEEDMQALYEVSQDPSLARVIVDQRNGRDQYVHYGATNWWETYFRETYPTQIYSASISGGTEKLKTYFSYRNYQSKGILKVQDDTYDKYNLRNKTDIQATDWLTFSNNMQYNSSEDLEHGGSQYGSYNDVWSGNMWVHALPSYVPVNPNGGALWRTELNNYTIGDGLYASLLQGSSKQQTNDNEFSNIASVEIKPIAGVTLNANYAIRRSNYSRYQRSTRIPYSIYPEQIDLMGNDYLNEFRTESKYDAFNIYGEYKGSFGDHAIKTTIGYNQETFLTQSIAASKQNLISDDLVSLGLATSNPTTTGSASEWALQGLFYRATYDYKDKYVLELNGRYDATSRFPSDYRWGFFPSTSAAWLINKEGFFKNLTGKTFDLLKLRASYGSLGNQNIDDYAYFPTMPNGLYNYVLNGSQLNYIESPALNPTEITWEKVSTLDFGLDFEILNRRLSASFDWFMRDTKGMLSPGATLPSVLGTGSPLENAADLKTKGFELSLNYADSFELLGDPFSFSITGNLSNSKTKITRFQNPSLSLVDFYEGMTIGELWGYRIDGLFQSTEEIANHADQSFVSNRISSGGGLQPGDVKYMDLDGDGYVGEGENTVNDSGDREIIGNSAPQYLYSFTASAEWKGFDISAFFQGVGKQDWYPSSDSRIFWGPYNRPYNSYIRKDLANEIWTPENTDAYFPRNYGYVALGGSLEKVNDRYLQSVAYLRLKNLTLGYTIPENVIFKSPTTKLRFYFSGENLLTFSPLTDYIDPEAASASVNLNNPSTSANRGKAQTTPFSTTYSLGMSLKF
ncbi:SusC/RagA family TonB-linked outer membrane protein [Algibacter lectus]|uniref:SusC/RagA family TonB-linked outer membrane protein n=1 Tax=Algibacter lectus TaxID=221126 RepID=UPI0026EE68F4|nr:TonB-dependent receptor [Algibacter lectus]MDO7135959.1 TonB-dependent receptor [Algibacter lectus]